MTLRARPRQKTYDYFYDTKYHLTEEGAKVRTKQLIMDLKRWMEEKSHE